MDRDYIREHDVIDRYLAGRLSADEQAAFEAHCLWCEETQVELELTEQLRRGLLDVVGRPSLGTLIVRMLRSPQFAVAATLLLTISLTASGLMYRELRRGPGAGLASTLVYPLEVTRAAPGQGPSTVVRLPESGTQPLIFLLYPTLEPQRQYRVRLYRAGEDQPLWQISGIEPGNEDTLALSVPATLLDPGEYRLVVEGLDAGASPEAQPALIEEVGFRAER